MQVFPSKEKPKNNTVQVSFVRKNACFFFGCTGLIQDTCIYIKENNFIHDPSHACVKMDVRKMADDEIAVYFIG